MPARPRRSTSTAWSATISCATQPEMGDLMITLLPKGDRSRSSHEVAVDLREKLKAIPLPAGGSLKVVETPPGPPVLATLLAEIYGPGRSHPPEDRRAGRGDLQVGALHRRCRQQLRPAPPDAQADP